MPMCRFCNRLNPEGNDRCENCGAWIETEAKPRPDAPKTGEAAEIPADLQEQIRSLMAQGRKIEAIKVYREALGAGLKDAKDAVEAIGSGSVVQELEKMDLAVEILALL